MDFLIKKYLQLRESFAVAMFICGLPFIFFFRDGLALAPSSTVFTFLGLVIPFAIALPSRNYLTFYMPNKVGYFLFTLVFGIIILYFVLGDHYTLSPIKFEKSIVLSLSVFVFLIILTFDKALIEKHFIQVALFVCLFGCLGLLYIMFTNPNYVFGQRAAINTIVNGKEVQGNPHSYSRTAFFGLVLSFLLIKYYKKFRVGIMVALLFALIFITVLFFTQTMVAILSSMIFVAVFILINLRFKSFLNFAKDILYRWYIILLLLFGIFKIGQFIDKNPDIFKSATYVISSRFEKIYNSISGTAKEGTDDMAASGRVYMLSIFNKNFQDNIDHHNLRYLFFGNGFQNVYLDNPWVESFDSYGLFFFLLYTYFFIFMLRTCFAEMKKPTGIFTEFLAYGFIYYFLLNITGGMIVDHLRIGYFAFVLRFINSKA